MLSEQKLIEGQVTDFAGHAEERELEIGNSRFGITIIMTLAFFVGAWGCISLLNGIAQTHNIQELSRGFITALTGI